MSAAAMTYDSLVQDIKDYLERGDENDVTVLRQIPHVINNSERTLADKLKITGYLASYVSEMNISENRIAKPQNWRSTASINFGSGPDFNKRTILRERSYEYMRAIFPNDQALNAPQFYCDYDLEHWLVLPTPSDEYPFEAMCYILPLLLDDHNQQNYLTKYAPFLLLYTCLAGMEPFLRNDSRIETWKTLADDNFQAINAEDVKRMVDRGQMRMTN
jgi:hypothetical protein